MCQPEIGHTLFLIANHFNSKSGDDPLFSFAQPPVLVSEIQRNQQAQIVNDFVDAILALDPNANIVALGDFNDFQFSTPLAILKGGVLTDLITGLPTAEQYSYVYDGNSQVLDHILISNHLLTPNEAGFALFDVVHANAEFPPAARATDHDPSLVRFTLEATPANVTLTNLTAGPVISIGRRSRRTPRRARPPRSQPFRIMPGPIARREPCRCGCAKSKS